MEYKDFIAAIRQKLNDPNDSISELAKADALNLFQLEICAEFELLTEIADNLDVAADGYFDLDANLSNFIAPAHAYYNDKEIFYISLEELSRSNSNWISQIGTPTSYTLLSGKMRMYPYSGEAETAMLDMVYLKKPLPMTTLHQKPFDGVERLEPFHKILLYRTLQYLASNAGMEKKYAIFKAEEEAALERIGDYIESDSHGHEKASPYEPYKY